MCGVLICMAVFGEYKYYRPVSRVNENFMAYNYDMYYHLYPVNEAYDENSPFVISDYDMDIVFNDLINAKCTVTLADDAEGEYIFTLYHNLKLKKVLVDGKKADYKRDKDFVYVKRPKGAKITFEYYGNVDYCVVDERYVYIPEELPIYPVAGKKIALTGNPDNSMNDYVSHMKVKVNRDGIYSNLPKTGNCTYEGDVRGLYLNKTDTREIKACDRILLVPKYICSDLVCDDEKNIEC